MLSNLNNFIPKNSGNVLKNSENINVVKKDVSNRIYSNVPTFFQ